MSGHPGTRRLALAGVLLALALTGCGGGEDAGDSRADEGNGATAAASQEPSPRPTAVPESFPGSIDLVEGRLESVEETESIAGVQISAQGEVDEVAETAFSSVLAAGFTEHQRGEAGEGRTLLAEDDTHRLSVTVQPQGDRTLVSYAAAPKG